MILGPISVCGAMLLGVALLWSVRLIYSGREATSDDVLRLVLSIGGWTLVNAGLLSVAAQVVFVIPDPSIGLAPWLGSMVLGTCFISPLALAIFGMAIVRYRALEWTSLMWLLAAAASREIPLRQAVRSFARERSDEVGVRAARLADLLDDGVGLPEALERSRTWLPLEGLLAARYGTEMGDLRTAIAVITRNNEDMQSLVRSTVERIFYLGVVLLSVLLLLSFTNFQLLQVFAGLFDEFEIQPAPITEALFDIGDMVNASFLPIIAFSALAWLVLLCTCACYYLGWLPRDVPGLGRLTRRYDAAMIMRTLAVAVQQGRSINRVIWVLARVYPRRAVRRRLQRAGERMNNGEHWCDSLRRQRLITPSDAGVFKAAQRVGNLEWALDEMADSSVRRIMYRLMFWLNVSFPVVLLLVAVIVGFVVIGLFDPLVRLIESLP